MNKTVTLLSFLIMSLSLLGGNYSYKPKNLNYDALLVKSLKNHFSYPFINNLDKDFSVDINPMNSLSFTIHNGLLFPNLLFGMAVLTDERLQNALSPYTNGITGVARFVLPGVREQYIDDWSVEAKFYYRYSIPSGILKDFEHFAYPKRELSKMNTLNKGDQVGLEVLYMSGFFNFGGYYSTSDLTFDNKYAIRKNNNFGYFTQTEYEFTNSFYFRLGGVNLFETILGVGGYDVFIAQYHSSGDYIDSRKVADLFLKPVIGVSYFLELEREKNYVFSIFAKIFDGRIRGGAWVQLLNLIEYDMSFRVEGNFISTKLFENRKMWDYEDWFQYSLSLRLRYGF